MRFQLLTLLLSAALAAPAARAQAAPLQSTDQTLAIDSGFVSNSNPAMDLRGVAAPVWSTLVTVPGASWVRLQYSGILLSGAPDRGSDGSYLKITSLRDGQFQTQHLVHVEQWQMTSAYFNGDAVLVEIFACPGTGANRLMIGKATAGPVAPVGVDTICGTSDDRVLSNDPRVGRLVPVGCTGWLINDCNKCFLTAGHCTGISMQVLEFNCPLSSPTGAIVHPGPQDQYAVDYSSVQSSGGSSSPGNDWAYFGVYPNSTTGLTPYQANGGQAFTLTSVPPTPNNQPLRVTGYGIVSPPVSATWEQVQKTHVGPYSALVGTRAEYQTDTTGGNSGSPVFGDGLSTAIAIHTHGGCTGTGGANLGTTGNNTALQGALSSPQGICFCPPIAFQFPNRLPTSVSPAGNSTIRFQITGTSPLQPGSAMFHWSTTGSSFQQVAPTDLGNNLFEVTVPQLSCQDTLYYYFSAQDNVLQNYVSPLGAPLNSYFATVATSFATVRNYDFNTAPPGWTVADTNVTGGSWERGTPNDNGGPPLDYDGSGQCWVTGNSQGNDVDGGPTRLLTETIDVSAASNAIVRYALWFTCSSGEDRLVVEATQDNGTTWVPIQTYAPFLGWRLEGFRVLDHFPTLGQLRIRFSVADSPNNSQTEAALDAFQVADATCPPPTWTAFGTGCSATGPAPTLNLVSLPALGGVFVLTTNNLGSGAPFMIGSFTGLNPPVSLTQYGFPAGCTLYVQPDAVFFLPGGILGFSIPNNPALSGVRLYNQVIELNTPPAVSNAGVAEIR